MKVTQAYWDFYQRDQNKMSVLSLHSSNMKTKCIRSAHIKNNLNCSGSTVTASRASLRTSLTNFSCLAHVLRCHFLQALNESSLAECLCSPLFFPTWILGTLCSKAICAWQMCSKHMHISRFLHLLDLDGNRVQVACC